MCTSFTTLFPLQVALHFVKDERTRFALGIECGNLDVSWHTHFNCLAYVGVAPLEVILCTLCYIEHQHSVACVCVCTS